MAEITILSPRAIEQVERLIDKAAAARPSLIPNQRRGRPLGEGGAVGAGRWIEANITGGIPGDQPVYSARGVDFPDVTVKNQRPFFRDTDSSVAIQQAGLGDECFLFRDSDEVWRLALVPETMKTDDCESVAASRNNMLVTTITTSPANALPITADLVLADTTLGNITITLPEEEVGKRVAVCNIGNTGHIVTITNEFYGVDGLIIRSFKSTVDSVYTGVTNLGWIIT